MLMFLKGVEMCDQVMASVCVCRGFQSSRPSTTPSLLLASPLRISRKPSLVKNSSLWWSVGCTSQKTPWEPGHTHTPTPTQETSISLFSAHKINCSLPTKNTTVKHSSVYVCQKKKLNVICNALETYSHPTSCFMFCNVTIKYLNVSLLEF